MATVLLLIYLSIGCLVFFDGLKKLEITTETQEARDKMNTVMVFCLIMFALVWPMIVLAAIILTLNDIFRKSLNNKN